LTERANFDSISLERKRAPQKCVSAGGKMAKLKTGRHTSAIKEARQNRKKRAANRKMKAALKTEIKEYKAAISAKDGKSTEKIAGIQGILDKMAKKKIFARGRSNRLKSRLSALSKKA